MQDAKIKILCAECNGELFLKFDPAIVTRSGERVLYVEECEECTENLRNELEDKYENEYSRGYKDGNKDGYAEGHKVGFVDGYNKCYDKYVKTKAGENNE